MHDDGVKEPADVSYSECLFPAVKRGRENIVVCSCYSEANEWNAIQEDFGLLPLEVYSAY